MCCDPIVFKKAGLEAVGLPTDKCCEFINKIYNADYTNETLPIISSILSRKTLNIYFPNGYSGFLGVGGRREFHAKEDIHVNLESEGYGFNPNCAGHEMHIESHHLFEKELVEYIKMLCDFHGFRVVEPKCYYGYRITIINEHPETQMIFAEIHAHNNGMQIMALRRIQPNK